MDGHDDPGPTPTRMWFSLLRRLGRGLAGRRIAVRDTAATVVSMHGKPDGHGWAFGRARDVHVVLRDVTAPELTARELVIECDTLTVGPTVTATGVSITATVSPEAFGTVGDTTGSSPRIAVVDGELRSSWLPGIAMVLRPEVRESDLRFTPTAVLTPVGRWSSWGLLPSGTTPSPELPGGLRITGITTVDDAVVIRAGIDRWTASAADRPRLRELLAAATQDRAVSEAV